MSMATVSTTSGVSPANRPGSAVVLNAPTSATPTLALDKPGTYVGQLIVNDGTVDSAPDTVTISTLNSKPVADAGDDQHAVLSSTVTLSGTDSSDVDGDVLTYQWSLVSKPARRQQCSPHRPPSLLALCSTHLALVLQLLVHDGTVESDPDTVTVTTQNVKPVADAGDDQVQLVGQTVQLVGSESSDVDGNPLTYAWSFTTLPDTSTATLSSTTAVNPTFVPDLPGTYVVQLIVNDGQLDSEPDAALITITVPDTTPPPPADTGKITLSPVSNGQVTLTGSTGSVEGGAERYAHQHTDQSERDGDCQRRWQTLRPAPGAERRHTLIIVTDSAGNASAPAALTVEPPLPPDPVTVAPSLNLTVATDLASATAFLYTGANPIQTGVAAGTIEAKRVVLARGKVLQRNGNPLSGVTVSVLDHPELGQTLSRADGMFDLVINGGGDRYA